MSTARLETQQVFFEVLMQLVQLENVENVQAPLEVLTLGLVLTQRSHRLNSVLLDNNQYNHGSS